MTRTFYAADFNDRWFEPMPKDERTSWKHHLIRQNDFHRVIVDEVTAHDLVSLHSEEIVEWARACAASIEIEQTEDIAEQYAKFTHYLREHPCKEMTWNVFLNVLGCEYTTENLVQVCGREVPFDDKTGIYAAMVGDAYYIRSRGWWNHFWRVTMLTTEKVPTRIIQAIDRESAATGEQQDDRFKVYEFGLPESSRDTVTIELQNDCKKETLADLARAYHNEYPSAEIISDMLKNRIADFAVTTHMRAKGSNGFIGSDIVAFYNAPSPALFAELGALNSRFARSDLVRLFYRDRFEQTCGRNRGFRGQQGRDHRAIFPPRLHNWLTPALSVASYVGVQAKPRMHVNHESVGSTRNNDVEHTLLASAPAALLRNACSEPSNGLQ